MVECMLFQIFDELGDYIGNTVIQVDSVSRAPLRNGGNVSKQKTSAANQL